MKQLHGDTTNVIPALKRQTSWRRHALG